MSDLNWKLRDYLHELRDDGRLYVLLTIYLHRNGRNRSYPSNKRIMKSTGYASAPVSEAIKWLIEHKAFLLVPYDKRVGEEVRLPKRKNIYQLTGVIELDGKLIEYLFMTPEGWHSIIYELRQLGESSLSEHLATEHESSLSEHSPTEHSLSEHKVGIKDSEVDKEKDGADKTAQVSVSLEGLNAFLKALGEYADSKRDVVFEAICTELFGITHSTINDKDTRGRINGLAKTARSSFETAYSAHLINGWSRPLEDKLGRAIQAFVKDWKKSKKDTELPLARGKFGTSFLVFLQTYNGNGAKPARSASPAPVNPPPTPEEQAALERARQTIRPAWEKEGVRK